jgi:glycosyltransferase involved in cell wall biosynthesis
MPFLKKKILSILWGPFGFRADELASLIGADRVSITVLYGPRYFAPIRYLVLFLRTLIILSTRKPDLVYAQNPPVFCPLTCLIYCKLSGATLLVDHHSVWKLKTLGRGPISRVIGILEEVVARAARANTTPHSLWARELLRMGGRGVVIIHDFVPRNPHGRDESLRRRFATEPIIAVSSHGGHPLERIEVEARSVRPFESIALLITGPREKLERRLSGTSLSKNVRYLGFLERETYERLKASADFAINVTDEPYTLSHVLFEYAASSLPIISSRQEVVEEVFGDSIMYVESPPSSSSSCVEATADKVGSLASDPRMLSSYRQKIQTKFEELSRKREEELSELRALFS